MGGLLVGAGGMIGPGGIVSAGTGRAGVWVKLGICGNAGAGTITSVFADGVGDAGGGTGNDSGGIGVIGFGVSDGDAIGAATEPLFSGGGFVRCKSVTVGTGGTG